MNKRKNYFAEYYRQNRDKILAKKAEYLSTPIGRANNLLSSYRTEDKKYNRGECTLSAEWIIQNIFSKPCAHCGKEGWEIIGCNRLDNSKPHTPENVEPCCLDCNCELEHPKKQVYQYNLDGLLVAIWPSANECGRNGYHQSAVSACCRGDYGHKTYKGYKWSYEPLQQKQQVRQLEFNFN